MEYKANNGLGAKISDKKNAQSAQSIKIIALDDFIKEQIDFIKVDIESYEYRMLLGSEKTIRKYKPCLAVCIYHNAVDFYSIPLLIKQMMPTANMAIRHHSNTLSETVLYVWPQ